MQLYFTTYFNLIKIAVGENCSLKPHSCVYIIKMSFKIMQTFGTHDLVFE